MDIQNHGLKKSNSSNIWLFEEIYLQFQLGKKKCEALSFVGAAKRRKPSTLNSIDL